jgi:hypothetical protein
MNNNCIYVISTFERLEAGGMSGVILDDIRTVGWKPSFEDAVEAVIENRCDIFDGCYGYACIEEIEPGLYKEPRNQWFYKYDAKKDRYKRIDKPEFMRNSYPIAFG